jgi:ribose transport system ATP-binding protein
MASTTSTAESSNGQASGGDRPWVVVHGISKTFGPVKALRAVDFEVRPGEIHGLVGQNGSGKSTLIKILSGLYPADENAGTIEVAGERLSNPIRPNELRRSGLAFVHQDLGLLGEHNVTENVRLGQLRAHRLTRWVNWRAEREATKRTLVRLHADFDPDVLVNKLLPGQRALVAIARALQNLQEGSGCIVFDESTQSLPREVLPDFYATVRRLAEAGTAVVLVSHRLDEVLSLADRVTVFQDGAVVAGGKSTDGLSEAELVRIVLGREVQLEDLPKTGAGKGQGASFSIRGASGRLLHDFSLEAHGGEVIGLTGATGAGHEEIPYMLAGATSGASGSIVVDGNEIDLGSARPHEMIDAGVMLVPEQRAIEGLALPLSAEENLTLPRVAGKGRALMRSAWQADEFRRAVDMLGIVPPNPKSPVASFSGGNQQKIMLGKWLLGDPRILILHEPTQAVDVGARIDILRAVRAAAEGGVCVLISSIEPQDLAFVCDRVLVLRDGQMACELTGELPHADITSATYDGVEPEQTPTAEGRQ